MKNIWKFLGFLFSLSTLLYAQEQNDAYSNYRAHIAALCAPKMTGRLPGTTGAELAKNYIINELKKIGVAPLAGEDYTMPFQIIKMSVYQKEKSRISCATDSNFFQMPSDDSYFPVFFSENKTLPDKDIVFAGYGITEEGYDDFADIDVKDKIVLLMRYDYTESAGENYQPLAGSVLNTKLKLAIEKGAAAVLLFNGLNSYQQGTRDIFYRPRFHFTLQEDLNKTPFFFLKHEAIAVIEEATGLSFSAIQKEIDSNKKPKSFLIPNFKMQFKCTFQNSLIKTSNIAAVISGSDAELNKEYIVVNAHYDHIGYGDFASRTFSIGSHQMHPGADDNASGVAAVLEMTKSLIKAPKKRSIIILFTTAEEMGLFGAIKFLRQNEPLIPKIKAMVNLDTIGCYRKEHGIRVNGADTCVLFKKSLEKSLSENLKINYTQYSPADAMADHGPFFERGIPAISLFTGFHERLHHTTDTLDFLNLEGLKDITESTTKFVLDLATTKEALELNKEYQPQPIADLGINLMKDNNRTKILTITEDSPAAKAGLLSGDIIMQVDQVNILSPYDFLTIIKDYSVGSKLPILIMRETQKSIEKFVVTLDL